MEDSCKIAVDFLTELELRNCNHITRQILQNIGIVGLSNAVSVSQTWCEVVLDHLDNEGQKDIFEWFHHLSRESFDPDLCR